MFSKSPRNIDARRLLWRKCPISNPVKAASRGPHCPVGTPAGKLAWVVMPQQGQWPRKSWYSSMIGWIGGKSQTWCRVGGVGLQIATAATASVGMTRRHRGALLGRNQYSGVPFVALLSALFAFFARPFLRLWLGVGMLGAWGKRRVAWRQLLDLLGERFDLLRQFINPPLIPSHKCLDEVACRFGLERKFDSMLPLAHASIGPENGNPSPDRFSKILHRPVNGYIRRQAVTSCFRPI